MKKKLLIALSCAAMILSLAACSTQTPPAGSGTGDGSQPPAVEEGMTIAGGNPCPVNMIPDEESFYPYMGMSVKLPEHLLTAVRDNIVFMRADEDVEYTDLGGDSVSPDWKPNDEHTVFHKGLFEFLYLPEGMRDRTPYMGMEEPMSYEEYQTWITQAIPMMRLSAFAKAEFEEAMLDEDGYANHEKLGENTNFFFYLSWNDPAEELAQEGKELFAARNALKQGVSFSEPMPVDDFYLGFTTPKIDFAAQVGLFQTTTLDGTSIDQTVFAEKKLTMINAWTTWCGPCIEELPDLAELTGELEELDAQIIGICCDTYDKRAQAVDEETLELAQVVVERTGVQFPTLIPDGALNENLLGSVVGYPTTWFVDSEGNVVGDPVMGSHTKDEWKAMIQERLAEVEK